VAVIVAIALAILATAGAAHADNPGWMTCTGRVGSVSMNYYAQNHTWYEQDHHTCLLNQTYSWEVQYSTDGGKHWYDWVSDHVVTSGLCQNGCIHHGTDTGSSCSSNKTVSYRAQAWWKGDRVTSKGYSAAWACGGGAV
jgi:hypothetical protein